MKKKEKVVLKINGKIVCYLTSCIINIDKYHIKVSVKTMVGYVDLHSN